jgi:DNA polymerase I-like protein with 3'-5' exonuclease and polymerase domains
MAFNPKTYLAVDCETTGLYHWLGDRPFMVTMADQDGGVWFCEWDVDPFDRKVRYDPKDIKFIRNLLEDPKLPKVFHNSKFDLRHLSHAGVGYAGPIHDVLIAGRVCNTLRWSYGLKDMAWSFMGIPRDDEEELGAIVEKARRVAKKLGWALATGDRFGDSPAKADYWLPGMLWTAKNEDMLDYLPDGMEWPEIPDEWETACRNYGLRDAFRTIKVWDCLRVQLGDDPVRHATYKQEMKLWHVVWEMEGRGIRYDPISGEKERQAYAAKKEEKTQVLRDIIKNPKFNPGSPQQVGKVLFGGEPYELEVVKWTKANPPKPCCDADVLAVYENHEFVSQLISWRAAKKGTEFYEKYKLLAVADDLGTGSLVIHPSFNQAGAKTGRFSCQDPNMQQAADTSKSARSAEYINSRIPFGPRPGYLWYAFDYAQQEVRIFAEVSEEPLLMAALMEGRDINTEIANRAWGGKGNHAALDAMAHSLELGNSSFSRETAMSDDQKAILGVWEEYGWSMDKARKGVTSNLALEVADSFLARFDYDIVKAEKTLGLKRTRNKGKITMFNLIYGGGARAVMELLKCSEKEARATLQAILDAFPGIKPYMKTLSAQGERDGFITTRYGRRLDIDSAFSYRAVNYMVQGTAADMMKMAVYRCHHYLKGTGLDAHVVMTIHDEIVFEILAKHAYIPLLRGLARIMEDTQGRLEVPMPVEPNRIVNGWDEKAEFSLTA